MLRLSSTIRTNPPVSCAARITVPRRGLQLCERCQFRCTSAVKMSHCPHPAPPMPCPRTRLHARPRPPLPRPAPGRLQRVQDRKSTRLNSSHVKISYAVFCLKKKKLRHYLHPYTEVATLALPTIPAPHARYLHYYLYNAAAPPVIYTLPLHDALPILYKRREDVPLSPPRSTDALSPDPPACPPSTASTPSCSWSPPTCS